MVATPNSCVFEENPCNYPEIPRWAYLALAAMSNLHTYLATIDVSQTLCDKKPLAGIQLWFIEQTSVFKGSVANGFISGNVLDQYKKTNTSPDFTTQLVMLIIRTIITVIGIFLPIALPALATGSYFSEYFFPNW